MHKVERWRRGIGCDFELTASEDKPEVLMVPGTFLDCLILFALSHFSPASKVDIPVLGAEIDAFIRENRLQCCARCVGCGTSKSLFA